MSRPIHSLKHIQTSYRKYQWIALSCATFTIVTVILTTLSGVQLGSLGKIQAAAVKQNQIASSSMEDELKKLENQVATLESQLSEEKSGNDQLDKKNKLLSKKLTETQHALAAKAAESLQPPAAAPAIIEQVSSKEPEASSKNASQAEVPNLIRRQKTSISTISEGSKSTELAPNLTNHSDAVDPVPVDTVASTPDAPMAEGSTMPITKAPDQSTPMTQADVHSVTAENETTPVPAAGDPTESSRVQ